MLLRCAVMFACFADGQQAHHMRVVVWPEAHTVEHWSRIIPDFQQRESLELESVGSQSPGNSDKTSTVIKLANSENSDNRLTCSICKEEFYAASELLEHQNTQCHRPKIAECSVCGQQFHKSSDLKQHEALHEKDKLLSRQVDRKIADGNSSSGVDGTDMCKVCCKSYSSVDIHQKHEQVHAVEQSMLNSSVGVEHVFIPSNDGKSKQRQRVYYKCLRCDRRFLAFASFQQHKTGGCMHECRYCSKSFKNTSSRRRHELTHLPQRQCLPKPRSHICSQCGHGFTTKKNLNSHMLTHSGERPFPCREPGCSKRFAQTSTRAFHERTHSEDKPHICSVCGRRFKHTITLRLHMRVHGATTKLFKCQTCDKVFNRSCGLQSHIRIHTGEKPYTCSQCLMPFRSKSALTRHVRAIHTNEKPWHCSVCDKQFTQPGNLRTHMRVHTGEKPFLCSICGCHFSHSSSLKSHMKSHGVQCWCFALLRLWVLHAVVLYSVCRLQCSDSWT